VKATPSSLNGSTASPTSRGKVSRNFRHIRIRHRILWTITVLASTFRWRRANGDRPSTATPGRNRDHAAINAQRGVVFVSSSHPSLHSRDDLIEAVAGLPTTPCRSTARPEAEEESTTARKIEKISKLWPQSKKATRASSR
jgi:hypothetical protein